MSPQEAAPLTNTLSIRQGLSVGRLVTDVAAAYGIDFHPSVTAVVQAANHLYTHVDSRLDGDKTNSHPTREHLGGARLEHAGALPWARYLGQLYERGGVTPDPQLTTEQTGAFAQMRTVLDANGISARRRQAFNGRMLRWLYVSEGAKLAPNMVGSGNYARERQREGRLLANAFIELLPLDAQDHPEFDSFAKMLGRLIGGYKLMDGILDFKKDIEHGNTAVRNRALGRVSLLVPLVWQGANIAARKPTLMPTLVRKVLAAKANRNDTLNTSRTRV